MTATATDPLAFAKSIEGWMAPHELRWIYDTARMFEGGRVAEVGVWKGRSLAAWASGMQTGELIAVDIMHGKHSFDATPDPTQEADLYATLAQLSRAYLGLRHRLIAQPSVLAPVLVDGKVDCVFIDGDHRAEHVEADIKDWLPKVRHLGMICGHDYNEPQVRNTVDRLLDKVENPAGSIWYHVKLEKRNET